MKRSTTAPQARVLSDANAGVFTLTLNRPEAANAIALEQRDQIIDLLCQAGADEEVCVVVLRANGRHFCGGADVARITSNDLPRLSP